MESARSAAVHHHRAVQDRRPVAVLVCRQLCSRMRRRRCPLSQAELLPTSSLPRFACMCSFVQVLEFYTDHLAEYHKDFPKLRSAACIALSDRGSSSATATAWTSEVLTIGGLSTGTQAQAIKKGCHMVVVPWLNQVAHEHSGEIRRGGGVLTCKLRRRQAA